MIASTRTYKDIDINFSAHPVTGDLAKKVDAQAIMQSIRTLLSLSKYEKLFKPEIYSSLRAYLFEPIDNITASAIRNEIRTTIENYEPRVNLTEVMVTPQFDDNGYDVSLTFFIVNQTDPITVSMFLERIR